LKAFELTGVWPKDPIPVLKKFHYSTPEAQEELESEQVQKVTSWRELERLFKEAVPDKSSKSAKSLSASLHFLSTQFELVALENEGLRAALAIKKKHKGKGTVLSRLANPSGSLTMSPHTVEKALEALAQKEIEKEQEIARKANSKSAREAARVSKLALQASAQKQRQERAEAKKKEKAEKSERLTQQRREKAEARAAQPPPQKRKRSLSTVLKPVRKKQVVRQPGSGALGEGSGQVDESPRPVAPTRSSRSGRHIKIPSRFE
jgi:hypothetical protein